MDQWFYEKYILTTHMRHRRKYKLQSNVSLMIKPECRDVYQGWLLNCSSPHIIKAKDSRFQKKHVFCSIWVRTREGNRCDAIQFPFSDEFMKSLKTASSDLCDSLVLALDPFWFDATEFSKNSSSSRGSKFNINYKF